MTSLDVRLERFDVPVGALEATEEGTLTFRYAANYLANPRRLPISLAIPLREAPFADARTRAFFLNLLPENNQLDQVIEREGLDKDDIVGLLSHLGADLSGALSCLPAGAPPYKIPGSLADDYDLLTQKQLEDVVTRLGTSQPLPDELRDPSPVAGIQRKVALSETAHGFAVPKPGSGVPTTHILKVPDTALPREAFYEDCCAKLAQSAGLNVAPSRSEWIAGYEVLISTRFDRIVEDGRVYRVHQEDFAQALGLPPRLKYERDGRPGRVFDAPAIADLLQQTSVPALATLEFLKATFFNLAAGNTDNHAKNHSLIYERGAAPSFAPLYDLVPIRLSTRHHHLFAFNIGRSKQLDELTSDDILAFLDVFGLRAGRAERFLRNDILPILKILGAPADATSDWRKRLDEQIVTDTQFLLDRIQPIIGSKSQRVADPQRGAEGASE